VLGLTSVQGKRLPAAQPNRYLSFLRIPFAADGLEFFSEVGVPYFFGDHFRRLPSIATPALLS